ncbi:MAG: TolC family protein [Prevotella sp.]|nr:TolC family protein [Prevotella sp.]
MRLLQTILLLSLSALPVFSQQRLTLDDCRQLALSNNKQLAVSRAKQSMASDLRKAARTKYLPKVDALAGYEYTSREISLLSNSQKDFLSNLGTSAVGKITEPLSAVMTQMVQEGILRPEDVQAIQERVNPVVNGVAEKGNAIGQDIRDAFRTNTHNLFAGSVMIRQPIYMGGAITALNNIADLGEEIASTDLDLRRQSTLYGIEEAYWLVVSLRHKQRLARSFYALVKQLNDDVHKMIDEGVATRADGLKVDVKLNEADMTITQANDGVSLAKMLLCQLCGLPLDSDITLSDEETDHIVGSVSSSDSTYTEGWERPELRMLQTGIDISREGETLARALYRPQILLTAGYLITNPSVYNSFENKFKGVFNVGVVARIPLWSWREGHYKASAARALTTIAELEYEETSEKISLQISQCRYKLTEAQKRLAMAQKNIASAEENLRCATVGFHEGVISSTDVLGAQTAWQQAHSQLIDAETDVQLSKTALRKALGEL